MTQDARTDAQLIAARRREDERRYLLSVTDPKLAPKLAPGMQALRSRLIEQGSLSWESAVATALRHSDLAVKTVDVMLRKLLMVGFLTKSGEYSRTYNRRTKNWVVTDTRTVRLVDWPEAKTEN
jgi:hypothetical protein